jgi:chorismate synthase
MAELTYHTAGESHGKALVILVNGMPAGLPIDEAFINAELRRRQGGYGRGGRQRIEQDAAEFVTGVRRGRTIGAPLVMQLVNRDSRLDDLERTPPLHRPRPGHADLAGSIKWLTTDCRETLERASARETASRVAAGALARCLLGSFGIEVFGFVRSIGPAATDIEIHPTELQAIRTRRDASDVYCPDDAASEAMRQVIRQAKEDGDTVGGIVEAHVIGCPPGLGSCANWYEKLDARLAATVMGIQAFKGIEIGLGFEAARRPGSQVHDEIVFDPQQRDAASLGYTRPTNRAGGLEGGMTNGQPIVVRGAMKPIATLLKPLASVDLNSHETTSAGYERSDVCAVSAASVVMENVVAFEVAAALRAKFGGDSLLEMQDQYERYLSLARQLPLADPQERS